MALQFLGNGHGASLENASFVISPFPYDITASYGTGARNAPLRILEASCQLELFDEELELEPYKAGIFTLSLPEVPIEPEKAKELSKKIATEIFMQGKIPVFIGGDHSISIGVIEAAVSFLEDVSILHLDAHTDMRHEYQGTALSHACVARRVSELCQVVQAGIRSASKEEWESLKRKGCLPVTASRIKENLELATEEILGKIKSKNLYITIDVDCLDPSIMPATGTPEPGGIDWFELTFILRNAAQRFNIAGFDVVELAPVPGLHFPEFTCARLIYKMVGYINKFGRSRSSK